LTYKARVQTLRLLVDSNYILRASPKLNLIVGEMHRILSSERVPRNNGWLLAVLHTTRTLDTSLAEILIYKGWISTPQSLGKYLVHLSSHNILRAAEKNDYNDKIVKKRNKYMHEAGAMPTQIEANSILSEMHACLSIVLARI
jgi:hypothetical protein